MPLWTCWGVLYGSGHYFRRLGMHLVNDLIDLEFKIAVVRTRGVACDARTPKPAYRAIVSGRDGLRAVPFFPLVAGARNDQADGTAAVPRMKNERRQEWLVSAGSSEICPYRGGAIPKWAVSGPGRVGPDLRAGRYYEAPPVRQ
jgi:hypothetical protein